METYIDDFHKSFYIPEIKNWRFTSHMYALYVLVTVAAHAVKHLNVIKRFNIFLCHRYYV